MEINDDSISFQTPLIYNDPIYVTGFLRRSLNIRPCYLNLRYSYKEKSYLKWLRSDSRPLPLPYLFAAVDTASTQNGGWKDTVGKMWEKTKKIHRKAAATSTSKKTNSIRGHR